MFRQKYSPADLILKQVLQQRNWKQALQLVKNGASLHSLDIGGFTLTHLAALNGDWQYIEMIISWGGCINVKDTLNYTPLHLAVLSQSVETVRVLITADVDIDTKEINGCSALYCAALVGNVDIARLLLKNGANPNAVSIDNSTPLHAAAGNNDFEMMKLLLENNGQVNSEPYQCYSVLHYAIAKDNNSIIQGIKYAEFIPHANSKSIDQKLQILKLLFEYGTNHRTLDPEGFTPVEYAIYIDSVEIVELLLSKDNYTDINCKNLNSGFGLLHQAVRFNRPEILKFLLRHHADVKIQDNNGDTPLHHAAANGTINNVQILLKYYAEVGATDNVGHTPINLSNLNDHHNVSLELFVAEQKTKFLTYIPTNTVCQFPPEIKILAGALNLVEFADEV